jgi:hypothetical protein
MRYELSEPLKITSRLLVGFRAGDGTVSIDIVGQQGDGRVVYRWFVDLDSGEEFSGDDLRSGCQGGDLADGLSSLCSFLAAFADAHDYAQHTGRESDCGDLFPLEMAEWAMGASDEISMVGCLIDEQQSETDEPILTETH